MSKKSSIELDHGRRTALKTLAASGGVIALSGTATAGTRALARIASPASGERPVHIGLLLPSSEHVPAMAENYLAGMRLASLDEMTGADRATIIVERIGTGRRAAADAACTLLKRDDLDAVISLAGNRTTLTLLPIFEEHGAPLLEVDLGEHGGSAADPSPLVTRSSFELCHANYLLGRWAARTIGRRAIVATSLYDGGYGALGAFHDGFTAGGGTAIGSLVFGGPTGFTHFSGIIDRIDDVRPDLVFAHYSGAPARAFVESYGRARMSSKIPIVASHFTAEHGLSAPIDSGSIDLISCTSWSASLGTRRNRVFTDAFHRRTGRRPDTFALLGYESAMLIVAAARDAAAAPWSTRLGDALAEARIRSPRGDLHVDGHTHALTFPFYLQRIGSVAGAPLRTALWPMPEGASDARRIAASRHVSGGWLAPYLCA